jgi:hypothetical protein
VHDTYTAWPALHAGDAYRAKARNAQRNAGYNIEIKTIF